MAVRALRLQPLKVALSSEEMVCQTAGQVFCRRSRPRDRREGRVATSSMTSGMLSAWPRERRQRRQARREYTLNAMVGGRSESLEGEAKVVGGRRDGSRGGPHMELEEGLPYLSSFPQRAPPVRLLTANIDGRGDPQM